MTWVTNPRPEAVGGFARQTRLRYIREHKRFNGLPHMVGPSIPFLSLLAMAVWQELILPLEEV